MSFLQNTEVYPQVLPITKTNNTLGLTAVDKQKTALGELKPPSRAADPTKRSRVTMAKILLKIPRS